VRPIRILYKWMILRRQSAESDRPPADNPHLDY
jgi:hypothetical protein